MVEEHMQRGNGDLFTLATELTKTRRKNLWW